jgi:hypothetical protein
MFLTFDLMEAKKKPLKGRKWHEGVNFLMKVAQQRQKPLDGSNQI